MSASTHSLSSGQLFCLPRAQGLTILCQSGLLWLTAGDGGRRRYRTACWRNAHDHPARQTGGGSRSRQPAERATRPGDRTSTHEPPGTGGKCNMADSVRQQDVCQSAHARKRRYSVARLIPS